jgi:hypothetical protein
MTENSAWRTSRVWQGLNFTIVIELIATQKADVKKSYLVANLYDASFTISLLKPLALMQTSSFSELIRKHMPSGTLMGTSLCETFNILFIKHQNQSFYLYFEKSNSNILHFVAHGKSLVRLSLKGNFTKAMPFEAPNIEKWTPLPFNFAKTLSNDSKAYESQENQDLVRRLKRRARTLHKSLQKFSAKVPSEEEINQYVYKIQLYSESLHSVTSGSTTIELLDETSGQILTIELDPSLSAGGNLDQFHKILKKLKKSYDVGSIYLKKLTHEVTDLNDIIEKITKENLPEVDLTKVLNRFQIPLNRQKNAPKDYPPESIPYREIIGKSGKFLVGKSAADNDQLCKSAKGNDYWFHTATAQGSHVILPAKYVKERKLNPLQLREGSILALHFSKKRADQCGEVHFTTRNLIKKTKSLDVGCWAIIRGETVFIRYDINELRSILDTPLAP